MTPPARHPACGIAAVIALLGAGLIAVPSGGQPPDERRSGFHFMTAATQALQRDDTQNPAMLWVADGERRWAEKPAGEGRACSGCHDDALRSMRGVAARYPAWDEATAAPLTLAGRINACRVRHQQQPALAPESDALLALEAFIAKASRGLPLAPPADRRLAPQRERGRQLYTMRLGQLDLSCAMCHDRLAGGRLGGSVIPQAHATGYPIYRLEWQALGSLQRRLRNCLAGVRAEVPPFGHPDLVALELHLAERAAGMTIESPAVRP